MKKSADNRFQPALEELERRDTPSTVVVGDAARPNLVVGHIRTNEPATHVALTPQQLFAELGIAEFLKDSADSFTSDLHYINALPAALLAPDANESATKLLDTPASERGLNYLLNYTLKSIRNYERDYGPVGNHDDIGQQVFLEWRQEVEDVSDANDPFEQLFARDSDEKVLLRRIVRRVISREQRQQNRRETADQETVQAVWEKPRGGEAADLQIDLETGTARLSGDEFAILMGRKENKTFDEIAGEMELPTSTVHGKFSAAVERLKRIYLRAT